MSDLYKLFLLNDPLCFLQPNERQPTLNWTGMRNQPDLDMIVTSNRQEAMALQSEKPMHYKLKSK